LPVNEVGKRVVEHCSNDHQTNKKATCLVKEIQRKQAYNVAAYDAMISKRIKQGDKQREKIDEKAIIEQQRISRIIQ